MVDPRFLADKDWVKQVLRQYVVHFVFPNPDGWVKGDVTTTTAGSSSPAPTTAGAT